MSAQPLSRADRKRCRRVGVPRCFGGRPAMFLHDEERISVVVAIDEASGKVTFGSMTRAQWRERHPDRSVDPNPVDWRNPTERDLIADIEQAAADLRARAFPDLDPATAFAGIDRDQPCGWSKS